MARPRAVLATLAFIGLSACTPAETGRIPDFEWEGEWVTIWGFETAVDETCAGTLPYLDDYAGFLANEFGLNHHLGVYRWYSKELFTELEPCGRPINGCAGLNGIFTNVMPIEHEIVHLVNDQVVLCPLFLAEGLAEYYGTTSSTPRSRDLSEILADPGATVFSSRNYPLAGAFTAFLVESHGLDALLEVCERSGFTPTPDEFDEAVEATLGVSTSDLVEQFASFDCTYLEYRSKQYECGRSPSIVIGDEPVELNVTLSCADERTIGPRKSEIWTNNVVQVLEDGVYYIALESETGMNTEDEIGLELVRCTNCTDSPRTYTYNLSIVPFFDLIQLEAGAYTFKVWGAPNVSQSLTLRLRLT